MISHGPPREKEGQTKFGEQPEQGNGGKRGGKDGLKVFSVCYPGTREASARNRSLGWGVLGNLSNETSPRFWVIVQWGGYVLETVLQRQKPGLNDTFYVKGLPPLVVDGYSKILKRKQLLRDKPQHIPVQPRTAQFNFPSLLLSPIPSPTPEQEIDSNQGSSPQSFSNHSSQAPLFPLLYTYLHFYPHDLIPPSEQPCRE